MMSKPNAMQLMIARFPKGAAVAYAAFVLMLISGTWSAIADILDRRADLAAAREILEQLDGRRLLPHNNDNAENVGPSGAPLLEGPTVTVAGASLLQRVTGQ